MNKKAFTLVELLATIIILGLLIVIIAPKITNTLKDAEKKTNLESAKNLVKTATYKVTNNEIVGNLENKKINYSTGENANYLDYTGEKPSEGQIHIKSNGQVAMAVKFGNYCYLKAYNSNDISEIPYNSETCGENAEVFANYEMPALATIGDGLYKVQNEQDRYIYRGANPNNHIWLDENGNSTRESTEMYRIISYESDGTIKVIRDTSIGQLAWDKSDSNDAELRHNENNTYCNYTGLYTGCNAWGTQSTTYYNDVTLTNLNQDFLFKYYPTNTSTNFEDYAVSGTVSKNSSLNEYLNHLIENDDYWAPAEVLDDYIANHQFNVGGIYYTTTYPANQAKSLIQEKEEQNAYKWNGKIGLMNITDYIETSLNPACTNIYSNYYYNSNYYYDTNSDGTKDQIVSGYDNWPCSNRNYNWMSKVITEWTIHAYTGTRNFMWNVSSSGYFTSNSANNAYKVRPSFYLKSQVKLGGFGTSEEPYYIIEN